MGLFEPDKYRTKEKEEREIEQIVVVSRCGQESVADGAERGRIIGESINFTRDLANERRIPEPTILADRAKSVAKDSAQHRRP